MPVVHVQASTEACQTIECHLSVRFCVILCRRLGSRNDLSSVSVSESIAFAVCIRSLRAALYVLGLEVCVFFVFLYKEEHQGLILVEACDAKFWGMSLSFLNPFFAEYLLSTHVWSCVCVVRLSSAWHEFLLHPNASDPLCHAQA